MLCNLHIRYCKSTILRFHIINGYRNVRVLILPQLQLSRTKRTNPVSYEKDKCIIKNLESNNLKFSRHKLQSLKKSFCQHCNVGTFPIL